MTSAAFPRLTAGFLFAPVALISSLGTWLAHTAESEAAL
jgi:hypothetical protein